MRSKYGFQTDQEREEDKKGGDAEATARRETRKHVLDATAQKIGPVIRDCLAGYFASLGLSMVDDAGQARAALFQEDDGIKGHSWKASSRIKTGSHSDYRADGVHVLDEHTVYTITVYLVVNYDNLPLLYIGDYTRSKLMGGTPVIASDFKLDVPAALAGTLASQTGIKQVGFVEFQAAQLN